MICFACAVLDRVDDVPALTDPVCAKHGRLEKRTVHIVHTAKVSCGETVRTLRLRGIEEFWAPKWVRQEQLVESAANVVEDEMNGLIVADDSASDTPG